MANMLSGRVRMGVFELDLKSGELHSLEAPTSKAILLREQVLQVLQLLVQRGGDIVTREEIKSKLWANDTVVDFDQSINATIKTLRRALGDSADNPRYIETLARRGYRLMVSIEYPQSVPESAFEKDPQQREPLAGQMGESAARVQRRIKPDWWRSALLVASAVILVAAGYISWRHFRATGTTRSGRIMLAVLPFQNLTGDPNKEYLADGLTEETISQLGRLNPGELGVIARTSVMGYKHKDVRLDQIGRDLSVQFVLENSLRENGDRLRLTAQLIQVKDQTHLWSQDYDYPVRDAIDVEDDVAKAVTREIGLRLTSQRQAELARPHAVSPEAFEAYFQGRYLGQDPDVAAKYFERATQLDSSYALAWVWLSHARYRQADSGRLPTEEGQRLAREAAERALVLDPNLAEAHEQMGDMKISLDFDWAGANTFYQRAIALDPGNARYLRSAAALAVILGHFDEGLTLGRRAVELDPLNARTLAGVGELKYRTGALDEAVADFKRSLELDPQRNPSHIFLAELYAVQGRSQDALSETEQERTGPLRLEDEAIAYHALGREKESDAALQELITKYHTIDAYQIAEVYAFRKQPDEAFKWLHQAYSQRDGGLIDTKVDPLLKNLYSDPRYVAFLKKLNLPS
jgi:TolB-like protein/DNA-binding winged helix-turn-helix (wHTH) protein